MSSYTEEEVFRALEVISTTILNCEKMQPKFKVGSSQHTLLLNRIKALSISKALLTGDLGVETFTLNELEEALAPLNSIIHKCKSGQKKHSDQTVTFKKLQKMIEAVEIGKSNIEEAISINSKR